MIHTLKIMPEYFAAVRDGVKRFELRENDRGFNVGDYLALNEYDGHGYTGRTELVKIIYMMDPNDVMTCEGGYALLSIEPVDRYDSNVREVIRNERDL